MADEATDTARRLFDLVNSDRQRLLKEKDVTVPSLRIFELLPKNPMITITAITKRLKITKPTAAKVVDVLLKCKILREYSGKKRDRVFAYTKYLDVLRDED